MKKNKIFLLLFFSFLLQAQTKNWTLEECVKYALEHNISIKQTALDTETSLIDKQGALGNFLPSLNASGTHSWNIGLNQDITTGLLQNRTTQFTSAGFNIGIDIYKGLQNQNALRKANLAVLASKYQLVKMQEDIALNVANAFLQVLFNKENLKIQESQKAIDEKKLRRSQELVAVGTLPRGELLDIKATLASDDQKVINATNMLLLSKLSLAQLLQLDNFGDFDVVDDTVVKDENNILAKEVKSIYDKAIESRTELKIAQTNLEIAQKNVAIARGGLQPTVRGFYNFNTRVSYADFAVRDNTGAIQLLPAPPFFNQFSDNKGQSFGLQLNIPIFNGFSVKNTLERSKVNLEKSKFALEQKKIDLQRSVYTAFTDAKSALKLYEAALTALEARQASYNYTQDKYELGLINSFELNQSQTLLSNSQSEVLRSKYDYLFKIKILEFYFGIPIIKN